ncbi:hypothetical protein AA313_de0210148 [Arthrobotrys entomopaga]|nr:hypothetical protein AA313_de0210148 [Arthrobotrys entomopaga]
MSQSASKISSKKAKETLNNYKIHEQNKTSPCACGELFRRNAYMYIFHPKCNVRFFRKNSVQYTVLVPRMTDHRLIWRSPIECHSFDMNISQFLRNNDVVLHFFGI